MTAALNFLGAFITGGFKPVNVIKSTYTLVAGGMFITNNSSGVTYTLPASAHLGNMIVITGKSGSWSISQNANQQILLGSQATTKGTGGSLASSTQNDSVALICITSGTATVWRAITSDTLIVV